MRSTFRTDALLPSDRFMGFPPNRHQVSVEGFPNLSWSLETKIREWIRIEDTAETSNYVHDMLVELRKSPTFLRALTEVLRSSPSGENSSAQDSRRSEVLSIGSRTAAVFTEALKRASTVLSQPEDQAPLLSSLADSSDTNVVLHGLHHSATSTAGAGASLSDAEGELTPAMEARLKQVVETHWSKVVLGYTVRERLKREAARTSLSHTEWTKRHRFTQLMADISISARNIYAVYEDTRTEHDIKGTLKRLLPHAETLGQRLKYLQTKYVSAASGSELPLSFELPPVKERKNLYLYDQYLYKHLEPHQTGWKLGRSKGKTSQTQTVAAPPVRSTRSGAERPRRQRTKDAMEDALIQLQNGWFELQKGLMTHIQELPRTARVVSQLLSAQQQIIHWVDTMSKHSGLGNQSAPSIFDRLSAPSVPTTRLSCIVIDHSSYKYRAALPTQVDGSSASPTDNPPEYTLPSSAATRPIGYSSHESGQGST